MLLAVFYEDSLYDYTDIVFNQTVSVIEPDQTINFKGFISMILSAILLFFGGFVIFVKISERIYGVPQGKRKT